MSVLLDQTSNLLGHDLLTLNLKKLMRKTGLSEAELSRKTHIPQATLHKILSGKTEDPRASTLKTLAVFFGVSIDSLLSGDADEKEAHAIPVQSIPVISWRECINATQFISGLTPANWERWVVTEFLSTQAYALCTKPSMEPRFPKNTILFIDRKVHPKDGDFVVVFYSGTEEATLRELSIDGPTQLLLPVTSSGEATVLDGKIKLLGVLVRSSFLY